MWKIVKNPFDPEQLDVINDDGTGWWQIFSFITPLCAVPAICFLTGANPFHPLNLFWAFLAGLVGAWLRSPAFGRLCGVVFVGSILLAFLWALGILHMIAYHLTTKT